MDKNKNKQSIKYELGKTEYILKRKLCELDALKKEVCGLNEVNSLCAAFLLYALAKEAHFVDGRLESEIKKCDVNSLVGKYSASASDGGDYYKITFTERETSEEN